MTQRVTIGTHDLDQPLPDDLGSFDVVVSSFAIHHLVPDRQRALYGEVFDRLRPGGLFANVEHVASRSDELHIAFLAAIGRTPEQDDPSNKLVRRPVAPATGSMTWAFGTSSATGSGASWPSSAVTGPSSAPSVAVCSHASRGTHAGRADVCT